MKAFARGSLFDGARVGVTVTEDCNQRGNLIKTAFIFQRGLGRTLLSFKTNPHCVTQL